MSKKKNSLRDEYATPITRIANIERNKTIMASIICIALIAALLFMIYVIVPKKFDVIGSDGSVIGNYFGSGFKSLDGYGTITLSDGTKITGMFVDGEVDPELKYTVSYANCGTYVGMIDDEFHPRGAGVYTNTDGVKIKSESWTWKKDNGASTGYSGMMNGGLQEGFGRSKNTLGWFEGEYLEDKYSGNVAFYDNNRTIRIDMKCAQGAAVGNATAKYLFDDSLPEIVGPWKSYTKENVEDSIYNGLGKYSGYSIGNKLVFGTLKIFIDTKYCQYNGTFIDGKIGGKGTFTYTDGSSFEIDQNCEYEINLTYPSNNTYTGMFVDNKRKGFGIFTFADAENVYYKGEFGNADGPDYGVETYKSGDKYVGEFENKDWIIARNGYGVYTWEDGDIYEGNWKNENRCGFGRYIYADGIVVEGEWTEDNDLPYGTITYKNGDTYKGQLTHLIPNGKGTMTWASIGTSFDGHFEKGILSGYGTYHSKLHGDISGIWKYFYDHKISDYWKYTGMLKDGVLCGYGVVEDSNPKNPRTIYGEFMNNNLNGQVRVVLSNGAFSDSEVKDGDINDIDGIYYLLVSKKE